MSPKPDASALAAPDSSWFFADDTFDAERGRALELGKELRQGCKPKDGQHQLTEAEKFTDSLFPAEPDPPPCWFVGGARDGDLSEVVALPESWERVSDHIDAPMVFSPKTYTCLVQGATDNGYLVEALQAVALRDHLVRRLFADYDPAYGLYVVLLYKNACWTRVVVDDKLPYGGGEPMCTTSTHWPSVCWPAILEKAYASKHGSYEGIGHGGSAGEAMVDLTGGVAGRFSCRDVSSDRLFLYLHELQAEALFVVRVDTRECAKPGVRFTTRAPYVLNRAAGCDGGQYVQLCCPAMAGGPLDDSLPHELLHSRFFPEKATDGFFWLPVAAFQKYFDEVVECRLAMPGIKNLDDIKLEGMPVPRPLSQQRPYSQQLFATLGTVRAPGLPEFTVRVKDGAAPCEVYVQLSQFDLRLLEKDEEHPDRAGYAATQLRLYQVLDTGKAGLEGSLCALVAQSGVVTGRDTMLGFRATAAGQFLVRLTTPVGTQMRRLILRVHSTAPPSHLEVTPAPVAGKHTWVEAKEPLAGNGLSLCGRTSEVRHAEEGDLATAAYLAGRGHPRGLVFDEYREQCAVQ